MSYTADGIAGVSGSAGQGMTRAQWRMVLLASLGGALEYYDFVVYGFFAHYIAKQFFPEASSFIGLLLSFAVMAIGYFIRPLGGIVLSSIGDRYGRRRVFLVSIAVVSAVTFCMSFLPNYASWGIAAPIMLVLLRAVQGFCIGGEMPGAITYAVEATPARAGLAVGIIIATLNFAGLLANGVNVAVQTLLTPENAALYGWRIAFFLGGLFGLISYWMRRNLEESPEFKKMQGSVVKQPFRETIRTHGGAVLVGGLSIATMGGFTGIFYGHMPAFLAQQAGYVPRDAAVAQNISLIVGAFGLLAAAWLGDKIPRRHILRVSAALLVALSWPFYVALTSHSVNLIVLCSLAWLVFSLTAGTWGAVLADLFPVHVRFSGIALCYNVSVVVFSSFAPIVASVLIQETGSLNAPALYVAAISAIAFVASFGIRRAQVRAQQPAA
ncbi:MFS transporter [Burkholderia sp. Bp9015]|uniref:MFS transporter n=1 Tax=Burkholderia sp. Bp9015 TaxID=2184563 RepID=UPI0021AB168D|nr:MFS transporter [Burkholderia sp. Bp9015]